MQNHQHLMAKKTQVLTHVLHACWGILGRRWWGNKWTRKSIRDIARYKNDKTRCDVQTEKSQKWIKSGYVTQSWKCHALYMWRGEHGQRDAITCWPAVRVISPPLGPADPGRTGASPSGEAPARETLWPPAITCRLTDISRHSPRRSDQPNDPGSIPLSEFASAIGETNFGPSTKKRGSEIKFTPCKNQRVGFRGSAAKNAVL